MRMGSGRRVWEGIGLAGDGLFDIGRSCDLMGFLGGKRLICGTVGLFLSLVGIGAITVDVMCLKRRMLLLLLWW